MNVLEAKHFFVEKTVEQALLEHVPLSDLEKRMMYFTESGEMPEDPIELNSTFEAKYDSAEYETKMSNLLRNAYKRLKQENPSSASTWDEAVQELRKGDHYLLVLLNDTPSISPRVGISRWSFWKLLGVSFLVLVVGLIAVVVLLHQMDSMPRH